jgi:hypothetical protein
VLALIKEVDDGGFDELLHVPVLAGVELALDTLFDLRRQVQIHGYCSSLHFTTGCGFGFPI